MSKPERQLFGTDGIRGVAGEYPLDRRTIFAIGQALGHRLLSAGGKRVVIGQDTRDSSTWIAELLASGLLSGGVEAESAGVITTPGVAYLARSNGFAAGVVISASHNPWQDNGIKVFSADGYKLPDAVEHQIEAEIFSLLDKSIPETTPRKLTDNSKLHANYVNWLASKVTDTHLGRLKVLVDCANGAASAVAADVFRACGAQATFICTSPDGRNINDRCGALYPEAVARAIAAHPGSYDLGITFDGDADRALFSDAAGRVVNGDAVLLLAAREMQQRGALAGSTVVATTMSNMGLEIALRKSGIRMLRAPVGDKYVLEEMQKTGATLGGEQSGHIIFRDTDATTGDGLLTALRVLQIVARSGKPLAELIADLRVFPQVIKNIRVREKKPLMEVPDVARSITAAEKELDGNGRVVVRYSGTEALARVMVEAETEEKMQRLTDSIADAIQRTLGQRT
ncbi:MAG TPA: phosphoglucosamine mutase [Terriglobales bacterium]|nr:phosphoglucosamine mutase [Terriglobales bacterium]